VRALLFFYIQCPNFCHMYSLLQPGVPSDIINRLAQLSPDAKPQWGKMNVSQMLAHCQVPLQVALGEKQLKRSFIGMLFGGVAKKQMLQETPVKKNLPTDPGFIIKNERDFTSERKQLQVLLQRFAREGAGIVVAQQHPFFGKITVEEWGFLSWKHIDHHLRQFGV
jgi:Protein of unknown function (DUF1569)